MVPLLYNYDTKIAELPREFGLMKSQYDRGLIDVDPDMKNPQGVPLFIKTDPIPKGLPRDWAPYFGSPQRRLIPRRQLTRDDYVYMNPDTMLDPRIEKDIEEQARARGSNMFSIRPQNFVNQARRSNRSLYLNKNQYVLNPRTRGSEITDLPEGKLKEFVESIAQSELVGGLESTIRDVSKQVSDATKNAKFINRIVAAVAKATGNDEITEFTKQINDALNRGVPVTDIIDKASKAPGGLTAAIFEALGN